LLGLACWVVSSWAPLGIRAVLDGRIVDAKTRLGEARAASRGGAPAQ